MLSLDALQRLCRARDRLCEPGEDALRIDDLAREAGLSTGQFIRRFAAVFGETPHQRRVRARLERARHLLAADTGSVTEVCMEVGFSSLGSCSDLFKRRVGIAPSAYRRQFRTLVPVAAGVPAALTPGCLSLMAAAFARLHQE